MMEESKNVIRFSIAKVSTEQFATIEEAFEEKRKIHLGTNLRFSIDREKQILAVFALFKFEQKGIPFLKVEVSGHFRIAPESWKKFLQKDESILVSKGFMTHLTMITVGTARGVLHTKTEGTRFNTFVLPTINVINLIKEDVLFRPRSKSFPAPRKFMAANK
jgi:hypothetical protein